MGTRKNQWKQIFDASSYWWKERHTISMKYEYEELT